VNAHLRHKTVFRLHKEGQIFFGIGEEHVFDSRQHNYPISEAFRKWLSGRAEWLFGFISYDYKNEIEKYRPARENTVQIPVIVFVQPECVAELVENKLVVHKGIWKNEYNDLLTEQGHNNDHLYLAPVTSREEYDAAIAQIHRHIQRGDIYEINYCQEFSATGKLHDPYGVFQRLQEQTLAPHAAYVQYGSWHVLCASPERFVAKKGKRIFSQPIKGTMKRGDDFAEDEAQKTALLRSKKDHAENVMITDLVRNDLSRIAERGSVVVDELCRLYTFKTVHHLISTISANTEVTDFVTILHALFPMGSMTGAPKISAVQIADQLEKTARGLYSGTIGYIDPNGDFDFNVVIRTAIYNSELELTTCHVGGAITSLSESGNEYDECLLKLKAIDQVLAQKTVQST
jgi:para-aminobenzoate synthetase component 1